MKICCISDTHEKHRQIIVPDGDVLICAGDITFKGSLDKIEDFADWMKALPHKHKICIFGNHELGIEAGPKRQPALKIMANSGIHYLEDDGIELDGIKYHGSPITPRFFDWEYNRDRGKDIAYHWAKIPDSTNVLITHGPPYMFRDEVPRDFGGTENVGCKDLLNRINELKELKLFVCGHLHSGYTAIPEVINGVQFVNASSCNNKYQPINPPVIVDL